MMPTHLIEQITIPYKKELLIRWKQREPSLVPTFMLNWNGPGISNGYGFGEWMSEQYFRDKGYYTLTNEFNLLSKTSKFKRYNDIVGVIIGQPKLQEFKEVVRLWGDQGFTIENPDLFVYNLETSFFVEAKKERDVLRDPQIRFMVLAKTILNVDSKLVYLSDSDEQESQKMIEVEFDLPVDI
jgi:hypothetical protein